MWLGIRDVMKRQSFISYRKSGRETTLDISNRAAWVVVILAIALLLAFGRDVAALVDVVRHAAPR